MFSDDSRKIGSVRYLPQCSLLIHLLLTFSIAGHVWPSTLSPPIAKNDLEKIRMIFDLPDDRIDLANVKLGIDQMVDSSIDIEKNLRQLDILTSSIKERIPIDAASREKLQALKYFLYKADTWNDYRPFQYDLDDPLGRNIENKLLQTYLTTRKGNCVSMPILFVILGQRIGLDVSLSAAPEHLFVKYRDETGNFYNLETTSGAGFARDVWIRKKLPMTERALENGIYMKPLNKKESIGVIAEILLEHYSRNNLEEQRIALANLILEYNSKHVMAMLHICSASYRLKQKLCMTKDKTLNDIPISERAYFMRLNENMRYWREKADTLGWKELD